MLLISENWCQQRTSVPKQRCGLVYIKALLEHYTKTSWLRKDPQATGPEQNVQKSSLSASGQGSMITKEPLGSSLIKMDEMH